MFNALEFCVFRIDGLKNRRSSSSRRRGGLTVLMTVILVAMSLFCMMTVNTAYIEMARTDLQTSTDLAVKSATGELGRSQDLSACQRMLERQLVLTDGGTRRGIEVISRRQGQLSKQSNGAYALVSSSGGAQVNAIQVTSRYPGLLGTFSIPFPFLASERVTVDATSTAARSDVDLVLCIDRSASMAWGLSNEPFLYPNGTKGLDNYFRPPDPEESRWASVKAGVSLLLDKASTGYVGGEARIGLVTFASDYRFGVFESERATLDNELTADVGAIQSSLADLSSRPLIGDTNISAGLGLVRRSRELGAKRQLTGRAVLVLLTDGRYTQGSDPRRRARGLARQGWQIFTISFSDQADTELLAEIASYGGGKHFHAATGKELEDAFREIAFSLPGILIK